MDVFPLTAMPQKISRAHPAPRAEATEFFALVSQLERHGKAVGSSAASDESVEAEAAASGDPVPPEEVSSQGTDNVRFAHGQPLVVARGEFGEALSSAASKPEGATSEQVTEPLATSRHEQLVPSGAASTPHDMRLGQATTGLEPTPAAGSPAALANGAGGGLAHTADVASLTAPTAMKVYSHSSTSVGVDHVPNAVKSSLELSQIATRQPEMSKVEVSSPDSPPVDPTLEGVVDGGGADYRRKSRAVTKFSRYAACRRSPLNGGGPSPAT